MELTDIKLLFQDLSKYEGKKVTVGGWIRSIRDSKAIGFIVLNDGTCFNPLQIVYTDQLNNFAEISKLNVGSAIVATGTIVATPDAKQEFEMQADEIAVEGTSTADFPLQKKRHSMEFLRHIPHLSARFTAFEAVFRVRSLAGYAVYMVLE